MRTTKYILAMMFLLPGSILLAQKLEVNTKASSIEWVGKKIASQHYGNITIKGKTEPITFEVFRTGKEYNASLGIDRSKFDVRYGSDSFFENLGDNAIDNIFTLEIKLLVI